MVCAGAQRDFSSSSLAAQPWGSAVVSALPLCVGHTLASAPKAALGYTSLPMWEGAGAIFKAHEPTQVVVGQSSDWVVQACSGRGQSSDQGNHACSGGRGLEWQLRCMRPLRWEGARVVVEVCGHAQVGGSRGSDLGMGARSGRRGPGW